MRVMIRAGRVPSVKLFAARRHLNPVANDDGSIMITLPLESTDFLFANWKPKT